MCPISFSCGVVSGEKRFYCISPQTLTEFHYVQVTGKNSSLTLLVLIFADFTVVQKSAKFVAAKKIFLG